LPKPNATLLLYPGLGLAMLRRLRRESLPVSIGGVLLLTTITNNKLAQGIDRIGRPFAF